jgi:thymidylate kinase
MTDPSWSGDGGSRGVFIVLVGPDGVGKTSVATELISRVGGHYFHFRPPLRREWTTPTPGETVRGSPPTPSGTPFAALRLTKAFIVFWLGYLRSVRPDLKAGGLVVADRWAYGYLVHPEKLGAVKAPKVIRLMLRAMPQPDAVFALVADAATIHMRKQELSLEDAAAEVDAWASLPLPQLTRLDANEPVTRVVDDLLRHLGRVV